MYLLKHGQEISGIQSPQADIKGGNFSFIEAWKFYPVPIGFK